MRCRWPVHPQCAVEDLAEKRYTPSALGIAAQLARIALLALAAGIGAGCRDAPARGSTAPDDSAKSRQGAAVDVVLPGVDTSAMTPRERREWSSLVTQLLAPCPTVPVSVAQCLQESRRCGACGQAAKWVARAVRDGSSEDQVRRAYKERFDPEGVHALPVDGSPTKGPEDAPVVVVEFADFECPHCREAVPLIDAVLSAHPDKLRLVYKSYTLPFHQRGEPAARAAFAAGLQGKFWEMEHLLFERQEHLEPSDLERYALMLKLDIPKWKADVDSSGVKDRIAHDRALGESLKLKGTPTIYVNGRELDIEQDESLDARVAAELGAPPVRAANKEGGASRDAGSP
jgi:protein-disulfide isomerase